MVDSGILFPLTLDVTMQQSIASTCTVVGLEVTNCEV